jgi:hypothetical protein
MTVKLGFDPEVNFASERISEEQLTNLARLMRTLIQNLPNNVGIGEVFEITIRHKQE